MKHSAHVYLYHRFLGFQCELLGFTWSAFLHRANADVELYTERELKRIHERAANNNAPYNMKGTLS